MKPLLLAALVLTAVPAHAEGIGKAPYIFAALGEASDLLSTQHALSIPGVYEKNPAWNWMQDKPAVMNLTVAGIGVVAAYLGHRFVEPKHPKVMKALLYGTGAMGFFYGAKNELNIPRYRRLAAQAGLR